MSKRLEEIKNELAKELGYDSWNVLQAGNMLDLSFMLEHQQKANDRYTYECCKATLEKASRNGLLLVSDQVLQTSKNLFAFFEKYENGTVRRKIEIDRKSIVDEQNITLL